MTDQSTNELSPTKQALLKIRELKRQLAAAQQGVAGPIAIVSMACRFPRRAQTPEAFWQCLLDGTDEVTDIPDDRWDLEAFYDEDPEVPGKMYARRGVFLDHLDLMDPEFFGISPREATWVDPQQRLLMEVGWEALERAGWPAEKIGEHTGIFVGWMHNDYQNEASDSFLNLNPYIATGAAGSFLCGRLAYYLGLQGPSVAIDTACSSSLVALHLACQSLQRGECDRALAGGVNAIVSPTTNILTCKLKALSPHGHSRAFDAGADGYLRGEGCGVLTLRRLADAERDGDPILGIIRGSSVGHNGFSSGLTAPNPKAQEKVIRQALERANVDAAEVAYLEAHGTGTELGDPIELRAAAAALADGRGFDDPLLVGSVKTNIGHLEAAAGMAGLIKVLLAMEHDVIPPQLNFDVPNPHIPWDKLPVKVVTEATEWPGSSPRRFAGVSAFGMSGTNAHVVLERPRKTSSASNGQRVTATKDERNRSERSADDPQLFVLSAKHEEAIPTMAANLASRMAAKPTLKIEDVAFTLGAGRGHFEHRAAFVASDRNQAIETFSTLERGGQAASLARGNSRRTPKVAWQFTGQGSQYVGMARGLYDSQPLFRDAIDHCDRLLRAWREDSLIEVLFAREVDIHHTSWTQPAIFAIQMGLAQLLESWALRPDVVLGHSVGQYAAACVAGIMPWDDGLRLISERGRLIGELPAGGRMLAVFASAADVEQEISRVDGVSLAAFNGTHIVISGPEQAIAAVESRFAERNIRAKALTTSHAFHSCLMEPALEPFRQFADQVAFQSGKIPVVCNVSGVAFAADYAPTSEYWSQHIREAVRFADSIQTAQDMGCELILEIGPQAVLTRMAAAVWQRPSSTLISCLEKGVDDAESLLKATGQLYANGVTPDFESMYAGKPCQCVVLPTYPFQRRRFWGPDKPRAFHAAFHTAHPLLGSRISLAGMANETRFESFLEEDSPPWLPDHQVMGHVVLPGAAFVELALAASNSGAVQDLAFEQPLRPTSRTSLQTVIRKNEEQQQTLETFSSPAEGSQWTRHFTAQLSESGNARPAAVDLTQLTEACPESASPEDFYRKMQELGLNYGPQFQTISSLRYSPTSVLAQLQTSGDVRGFTIPPTLLDGAFHSLAVGLLREDDGHLFLPVGIGRVVSYQTVESEVWCHATWTQPAGKLRTADLVLFTADGQVVAEITELKVQQISRTLLRQMSGSGSERLMYELAWQPYRLPAETTNITRWLIVHADAADGSVAGGVIAELAAKGHQVAQVKLVPDADLAAQPDGFFEMCGEVPSNWQQLLEPLTSESLGPLEGIAWLLSDDTQAMCTGLLNLINALHDREIRRLECGLQLITSDAVAFESDATVEPEQTKYWGLGRVIGAEQSPLRCRLIDIDSAEVGKPETATALVDILLTETRDSQLAIRGSQFFVPRMKQAAVNKRHSSGLETNPEASYLITGGLGMLGRQAAKWLADHGAKQIVLVSRGSPNTSTQAFLNSIEEVGCQVVVHTADITSRDDVQHMFDRFGYDLKPLAGVIHAAGALDDAVLAEQSWERFEQVLAPKVTGASLLHEFTQSLALDFFVLYSSAASVLGSPGQSNYATGNAFLDGLAWQRRALGLPAISVNWGPWTEGMADDERIVKRLALQGIAPLAVSEAHDTLEKMLASECVQALVMDVDWRRMRMGLGGESPALLDELTPTKQRAGVGDSQLVGKLKQLRGTAQKELLVQTLQNMLQGILSTPEAPETDRPLIEMGLDSLMAVEFGTEFQQLLGDQYAVGPAMLFDYPTIDAISDHVLELVAEEAGDSTAKNSETAAPTVKEARHVREDVAIIGMSCRFPGAENVHEFWENLLNRVDSVREVPDDRWDVERFYSADREPGKMYTREGGFLDEIANFDAAFFNISDQEACWIDPQHRLLLENSYRALEDAGVASYPLTDANVGVFMGIMGQDYAFLPSLDDAHVIQGFEGAGLSHSAGVGRISYVFGFEGPSVAVDTASSSSLVALFQAVRSLQDGDCNLALAGGVNAILVPVNSLLMSKAALLSPDGRCKSFSAQADGFGRGEGCGVVVLKRLSDARRDGDRIMAVVRGGSVVHNGFSGGITSPSGKSQSRVIREALHDAGIAPSQVQYLEAHGTGTELGDPMELGAAASVYGKGRQPNEPLLVGSVKANISHLEAAGGVSGLMKTVLALHHGVIPPQLHFEEPSPHIPWDRLPIKMVTEPTAWPATDRRVAGVTALGLVGTNAHVILSSADEVDTGQAETQTTGEPSLKERPAQLMLLSARTQQALVDVAAEYHGFLSKHSEIDLADICYTAAVGRRHHEHRAAFVVSSQTDALAQLASLSSSGDGGKSRNGSHGAVLKNGSPQVRTSVAKSAPQIAWLFADDRECPRAIVQSLYDTEPVFRELLVRLDESLTEHAAKTDQSVGGLAVWLQSETADSEDSDVIAFALQAGLATLWESWGVQPDIVLGVGIGQYTAACVAGGLRFEDAITLVFEREKILEQMAAMGLDAQQLTDESELTAEIIAALDRFESIADGYNYYPPNLPLVCSLSGEIVPVHRSLAGSYWRRHCCEQPKQLESLETLTGACDHVLEIGTGTTDSLQAEIEDREPTPIWLKSLPGPSDVYESMLHVLSQLYLAGLNPDFTAFHRPWQRNRISLPTYPFQRKRYWITEIADYLEAPTKTLSNQRI